MEIRSVPLSIDLRERIVAAVVVLFVVSALAPAVRR
jgi:hypothetical protein